MRLMNFFFPSTVFAQITLFLRPSVYGQFNEPFRNVLSVQDKRIRVTSTFSKIHIRADRVTD